MSCEKAPRKTRPRPCSSQELRNELLSKQRDVLSKQNALLLQQVQQCARWWKSGPRSGAAACEVKEKTEEEQKQMEEVMFKNCKMKQEPL